MQQPTQNNELREFALIIRDALLMIVRFIERKYMTTQTPPIAFGAKSSTLDRQVEK